MDQPESGSLKFLGNCPSAVYSYRFGESATAASRKAPSDVGGGGGGGDGVDGVKGGKTLARMFIFKASLMESSGGAEGQPAMPSTCARDFLWLNRSEAAQLFSSQGNDKFWRCIRSALFMERMPDRLVSRVISKCI